MAKTLPRISNLYNEFNTTISRMEYLLNYPKKLQQRSKNQLWDIYRLLLTALDEIEDVCGTPPCDILERIKPNDVSSFELKQMMNKVIAQQSVLINNQQSTEKVSERIIERTIERSNNSNQISASEQIVAERSVTEIANRLSVEDKKKYKYQYIQLLKNMRSYNYNSSMVVDLVDVIYRWFMKRFNTNYDYDSLKTKKYFYGMGQIAEGIYTIVISYANSVTHGTQSSFVADFDTWLNKLGVEAKATSSDTLPEFLQRSMYHLNEEPIHPQTLILWWIMIEPFADQFNELLSTYGDSLDPEYIDNLTYDSDYAYILDNLDDEDIRNNLTTSILNRYLLD